MLRDQGPAHLPALKGLRQEMHPLPVSEPLLGGSPAHRLGGVCLSSLFSPQLSPHPKGSFARVGGTCGGLETACPRVIAEGLGT